MQVTLLPATKRLKQLIKEHGAVWNRVWLGAHCQCFNGRPGIVISSLGGDEQGEPNHIRWVEPHHIQEITK